MRIRESALYLEDAKCIASHIVSFRKRVFDKERVKSVRHPVVEGILLTSW